MPPSSGRHLYEFALDSEFDPALVEGGLDFDENFCVPLKHLDPESTYPLGPGHRQRRQPAVAHAEALLRLRPDDPRAVEAQTAVPASRRPRHRRPVALGRPARVRQHQRGVRPRLPATASTDGDAGRLTDYTRDEIDAAGNGAHEIRTWLVAAGAAEAGFDVLAYEPVPEWLTGTAVAAARSADHVHQPATHQQKENNMSKLPKVTGRDMRGVMAYPPTPALPGAERVDAVDTVDLAETERMIRALIADGVDAIALNGTLGEMATLTLDEWKAFAACVAETVQGDRPGLPGLHRHHHPQHPRHGRADEVPRRPRHHRHAARPPDVGRHGRAR